MATQTMRQIDQNNLLGERPLAFTLFTQPIPKIQRLQNEHANFANHYSSLSDVIQANGGFSDPLIRLKFNSKRSKCQKWINY